MIIYKDEGAIPVKMWLDEVEDGAKAQIDNLAKLPFAFHHIAIMPDCHQGYGMPIGGVLATKAVVIPNAVGVDIGCGMCSVKTSLTEISQEQLKELMKEIRIVVPVGFKHQKESQDEMLMPDTDDRFVIISQEYNSALNQLGTLGGGNHFIEIQKGNDGHIWIMIHSGSRNIGLKVAEYYNKLAIKLNEKWFSSVDKKDELAFLPADSLEGLNYLIEMNYCIDFAYANRKLMMERVKNCFYKAGILTAEHIDKDFEPMINIAHNYVSLENHFNKNVWVHRKGATLAREGTIGIIPGSMGTHSYIVKGLGNPESFMSCSHGAGRVMGRGQAIRTLDLEKEQEIMKDILGGPRSKHELDESPSAYKDIQTVMANQKDLVEILVELTPLGVIKG